MKSEELFTGFSVAAGMDRGFNEAFNRYGTTVDCKGVGKRRHEWHDVRA